MPSDLRVDPERLWQSLMTILLGNLCVNLLFFASVPLLFQGSGTKDAFVTGLGALVALLILGEILPKTIALRAPELVARVVALPLASWPCSSASW